MTGPGPATGSRGAEGSDPGQVLQARPLATIVFLRVGRYALLFALLALPGAMLAAVEIDPALGVLALAPVAFVLIVGGALDVAVRGATRRVVWRPPELVVDRRWQGIRTTPEAIREVTEIDGRVNGLRILCHDGSRAFVWETEFDGERWAKLRAVLGNFEVPWQRATDLTGWRIWKM